MNTDFWKGLPPWVKAVFAVGAPTVAAAWFIFLFSNMLTGDMKDLQSSIQSHIVATDTALSRVNDARSIQEFKLDTLIRIATQQCVNAATDVVQRRDCLNAGGR